MAQNVTQTAPAPSADNSKACACCQHDQAGGKMSCAQRGSAFVACPRSKGLDLIFAQQFERMVNRDNTVSFQNLTLQIEGVNWRATLAGCTVIVHQHLDGTISLTHGPHRLGRFTAQGVAIPSSKNAATSAVEKTLREKAQEQAFPPRLETPQTARDSDFPTATTTAESAGAILDRITPRERRGAAEKK